MRRTSGLSLLILIFVSLCLITFSLLSVSESRADQALGEKIQSAAFKDRCTVSELFTTVFIRCIIYPGKQLL